MAKSRESRELAQAIRRHAVGAVGAVGQRIVKAQVIQTDPLSVELLGSDIVVETDHLLLGAWPRYFDRRYGLNEDDTVLMTRLDDGDWYLIDVISDEDFDLGDQPGDGTSDAYNTGFGQVVAEMPYQDVDGSVIGVLLLFDPTTLRDFSGHAAGTTDSRGDTVPSTHVTPDP